MEDNKIYIKPEKVDTILLKLVLNAIPELISNLISEKLENGSSYSKIAEEFETSKSIIWKIYKNNYFPVKKTQKEKFLKKYLELI